MRSLMQIVCILLLLIAQQSGLAHQIWHAHHEHTASQDAAHEHHEGDHGSQAALCDFHLAAGTVLSALDCAVVAPMPCAPAALRAFFSAGAHLNG